jgi:carbamoyltransferase
MMRGASGPVPRLDYSFFNPGLATHLTFSQKFYRETGLPADSKALREEQRKALARSVQEACAEVLSGMIEHFRRSEGVKPLCLAGGLFQNALLVSSLEKSFDQVFVPPAAANAGTALGAAFLAWYRRTHSQRSNSAFNVFCGPRFTNGQIKDVLDNCKARYSFQNTQERQLDVTVRLLRAGKIEGWFQNGCEFGPRALGARSVLASPWAPYVKENLNDFIKHREWFRPFAIAVPEEDSPRYFEASSDCRFMNSVATARPEMNRLPESFLLPQNRIRLHVVEKSPNRLLWQLLRRFGEYAPAPMLLNTSFNLPGEPLVVTPRDALRSYSCSGLDALVIGNFVLCKSSSSIATRDISVPESVSVGV